MRTRGGRPRGCLSHTNIIANPPDIDGTGTNAISGSVFNAGLISLAGGGAGDVLSIGGNYTGNNGTIRIDTVLGGDSSATDLVQIGGNTSGSTHVVVTNIGGTGAPTVEGIKVIDVAGTSNATFSLVGDYVIAGQQAVVAGAYGYTLWKNGVANPTDGDWYLRSQLAPVDPGAPGNPGNPGNPTSPVGTPLYQPGVPLYEVYAHSLLAFNGLPTLQQRVGNRYWSQPQPAQAVFCKAPGNNSQCAATADPSGYHQDGSIISGQNGVWGRIEAAHASFDPTRSTSGADYDRDLWKLQTGVDGMLKEFESGSLIAGINGFYGTIDTDVSAIYGTGTIDTTGYGFGGSLTWYGNNGFYVDGQASVTWYESDLKSDLAGTLAKDLDGLGYAFSVEAGKRYEVSSSWHLIPQAQLVYSNVGADSFYDRFDAHVLPGDGESLRGRLGLAVERQAGWTAANGQARQASVYGIANLYYEFLDGTSAVDVAGAPFVSGVDDFWGEIGIGGTVALTERLDLYGEARYATSFENAGDNSAYGGNIGLRFSW